MEWWRGAGRMEMASCTHPGRMGLTGHDHAGDDLLGPPAGPFHRLSLRGLDVLVYGTRSNSAL